MVFRDLFHFLMVTTSLDALSHCPFVVEQASDGVLFYSFFCFHNYFYLLFLPDKTAVKRGQRCSHRLPSVSSFARFCVQRYGFYLLLPKITHFILHK